MRASGCQIRLAYPHRHPMWRVFEMAIPFLDGLIGGAPERGPDGHGGDLAVAALPRPRFARHLVFLGQPRVERAAEVHVAGAAPGGDEDALVRSDVHGAAVVGGGDAERAARARALPDDARHLVPQQYLDALGPRALFERPDEPGADAGRMVGHPFGGDGPLDGALLPPRPRRLRGTHQVVLELDAVLDQELEGRRVLVREGADEVPVAVPALHVVVAHPVQVHLVRRVLHAVLALIAGAAAEVDVAAGAQAVPADVDVLFHHDHGGAVIERRDGRRKPGRAGADRDEIRGPVPEVLGLDAPGAEPGQRGRADAGGRALLEEGSPTDARIPACRSAHVSVLPSDSHSIGTAGKAQDVPRRGRRSRGGTRRQRRSRRLRSAIMRAGLPAGCYTSPQR